LVSADNGVTWVAVDTTRGLHNQWEEQAIHVASYVTPSAQVRVRFVAADLGTASTVEAGIDDVDVYDGALARVDVPRAREPRLRFDVVSPNPFTTRVQLVLSDLPQPRALAVNIVDIGGRLVRSLHRAPATAGTLQLTWDGRDQRGRSVPAGVYFAEAHVGSEATRVRLIRMP
jgi:flagellar hook capping protein FlgD